MSRGLSRLPECEPNMLMPPISQRMAQREARASTQLSSWVRAPDTLAEATRSSRNWSPSEPSGISAQDNREVLPPVSHPSSQFNQAETSLSDPRNEVDLVLHLQPSSFSAPAWWASAGRPGGGKERVETRTMDVSEILTFLAFEVVVLCVLAWRRHYGT